MLTLVKKYQFLFEELVKRDFKQKYKRTVLGMAWSVLSPLMQLSKNVSSLLNFGLTLIVFLLFVLIDGLPITPLFLMLLYPICCLIVFNIGMGLVLSALFVFFRDINYLYDVFTLMLMYCSAIFYTVDAFPAAAQNLFLLNPVYCYIKYFRVIVIDGNIPSLQYHLLCLFYAVVMVIIGGFIYKKYNQKFLYYM